MFTVKLINHQYQDWSITHLVSSEYISCSSFTVNEESKTIHIRQKDSTPLLITLANPDFTGDGKVRSVYAENMEGKTVFAHHGVEAVSEMKKYKKSIDDLRKELAED